MGVSSSADDLTEASRTLARKAMGDATAAREFAGNSDITDEIIGFHAQQAIEKWLKAIIAGRGESFEHTRDLRRLVRVAAHDLGNAPFDVHAVIALAQHRLRSESAQIALGRSLPLAFQRRQMRWRQQDRPAEEASFR